MKLVNIDDCNRELFYKQMGGKDNLITAESAFNMLMALPTVNYLVTDERARVIDEFANEMHRLMRLDGIIFEKEIDRIADRLKAIKQ